MNFFTVFPLLSKISSSFNPKLITKEIGYNMLITCLVICEQKLIGLEGVLCICFKITCSSRKNRNFNRVWIHCYTIYPTFNLFFLSWITQCIYVYFCWKEFQFKLMSTIEATLPLHIATLCRHIYILSFELHLFSNKNHVRGLHYIFFDTIIFILNVISYPKMNVFHPFIR